MRHSCHRIMPMVLLALTVDACGSQDVVSCGPGTALEGRQCVLDNTHEPPKPHKDVVTCGSGTILEDNQCVLENSPESRKSSEDNWSCYAVGKGGGKTYHVCLPANACEGVRQDEKKYWEPSPTCFPYDTAQMWCFQGARFNHVNEELPEYLCSPSKEDCDELEQTYVGWVLRECVDRGHRREVQTPTRDAWCEKRAGHWRGRRCGPNQHACGIAGTDANVDQAGEVPLCVEATKESVICYPVEEKGQWWKICYNDKNICNDDHDAQVKKHKNVDACTWLGLDGRW